MHRTQLYLTKDQTAALDRLARRKGLRRSALVRAAVDKLIAAESGKDGWKQAWAKACGAWKNQPEIPQRIRRVRADLNRRIPAR